MFSSNDYNAAKLWLLEDEYEPIEGRVLAAELIWATREFLENMIGLTVEEMLE